MARSTISMEAARPVQQLVEGMAKNLVEKLYGPDGPAWGTTIGEIETTLLAVRELLSTQMLHQALERQAKVETELICPSCQAALKPSRRRQRRLTTLAGETTWETPLAHCSRCRRDFSPSGTAVGSGRQSIQSGGAAASGDGSGGGSLVCTSPNALEGVS